jgi:hypothetical protein
MPIRRARAAIVLCRFGDLADITPRASEFYRDFFTEFGAGTGGAFDYWLDVTYGNLSLEGSQVFGWFTMSQTTQDRDNLTFPGGRSTLAQWGVDTATANDVDLSPFSIIIVVFNTQTDHGAAGGVRMVLGYSGTVWEPTFVFHEMGHCLGLDHSWSANPDTVYGDRWDIMSAMNVWTFRSNYGAPAGPGINAPYLRRLNCIPASRIWGPDRTRPQQTVTLAALSEPQAPGFLMVEVPAKFLGPIENRTYSIEFRRRTGWDKGIPGDIVLIHETRADSLSYLLAPQLVLGSGASFSTPTGNLKARLVSIDPVDNTAVVETIVQPFEEPARCKEIRGLISGKETEIDQLQEELKTAGPGEKPRIAAEIRALQAEIADLRAEGARLGCNLR